MVDLGIRRDLGIFRWSLLFLVLCAPSLAAAQSGGSLPPPDLKPADVSAVAEPVATTSSAQAASSPDSTSSAASLGSNPTSVTSGGFVKPPPASSSDPVVPASATPMAGSQPSTGAIPAAETTLDSSNGSSLLWPVFAALALVPFGFLVASLLKKKPKAKEESDRRCFDIKSLLDEKLQELTDVRRMAEGKLTKLAKEHMREAVQGTTAGDALVRIEKLETEYNRLKKMYEECIVDIERYKYKGVLIENSLFDKSILDTLKVVRTRLSGDWTLHDVRLGSNQIEDIQKHMTEEPWYFHLWEPGKKDVIVVFKNKIFTINYSDKTSWVDAVAFGKSIGIPESQLDFRME